MPDSETENRTLSLSRVAIDTYGENVAYLHRDCPLYRAEGFQALNKIFVEANGHQIFAVLNVVDDDTIVETTQLGLSEQAFAQISLAEGVPVRVSQARRPRSMEAVRKKIAGERLSYSEFQGITRDITDNRYSRMEMAAFVVATDQTGLDREEVLDLTRAMTETGQRLTWDAPLVADKHCIGGIPGNRTTMILVPILAAHGMLIPKTSSRAITSPAGTADTMSVLAEVELTPERMREILHQQRGFLAWGGTARMAPVDDLLISVERPLGIDSPGQMVASILSKKLAAGSTHLLVDIPVGATAKMRHMSHALQLRKLFEYVGDRLGLHVEVIITDGSQPIGQGIGPVLEARDVLRVLRNEPDAPFDLRQKSLRLAGRILEFDPDIRGGYGYGIARDILDTGRALQQMEAIIEAQGAVEQTLEPGPLQTEIPSPATGYVTAIDCYQMARIARLAGAPMDLRAGVDLLKKAGDRVTLGEPLYRIHAEFPADFRFSLQLAEEANGYTIGNQPPPTDINPDP
ncbi:MAG: thymidine phosphorylase family protein [Gammaproteobacteria bacterium]|nr:thymidine phosphorylase family protein [Gammaproteobacteria bacterium]